MFAGNIDVWTYLSETEKPIIVYGMGDGADKVLAAFDEYGIKADGFMASDDFVRGQSFRGFEVKKISEIEKIYDDFIIIVAFGTSRPEVMDRLYAYSERYEVYAPELPVYGGGLFSMKYLAENADIIKEARKCFADSQSVMVYDKLIEYKLTGRLDILKQITSPREDALKLLDIKSDGTETFVDLGAYNGDTVAEFLSLTQERFKKIYAFEPDTRNYMKLRRRFYRFNSSKLTTVNAAAWDCDGETEFFDKGGRNSSAREAGAKMKALKTVPARSVDSVCKSEKVTLIKFDVEGCEEKALNGASNVIKARPAPRLIVSAYHRTEDLFALPLLIRKLDRKYKIYLRHHDYIPAWDTNLYCI